MNNTMFEIQILGSDAPLRGGGRGKKVPFSLSVNIYSPKPVAKQCMRMHLCGTWRIIQPAPVAAATTRADETQGVTHDALQTCVCLVHNGVRTHALGKNLMKNTSAAVFGTCFCPHSTILR
jgi:hypothetical protein